MARTSDAKDKTVAAAMRLFRRRGFAGVGVQEILQEAGAPRGSLYFHFPGGKSQIGEIAMGRAAELVAVGIRRTAAQSVSAEDFLLKVADGMASDLQRSEFADGCPIATVALEMSGQDERLSEAGARAFSNWEVALSAGLAEQGVAEAEARPLAMQALALLEGALVLARSHRSLEPVTHAKAALRRLAAGVASKAPQAS